MSGSELGFGRQTAKARERVWNGAFLSFASYVGAKCILPTLPRYSGLYLPVFIDLWWLCWAGGRFPGLQVGCLGLCVHVQWM